MTQVDFYLLSQDNETARLQFSCRLVEKIYKKGHRLHICAENQQQLNQLDDLLWTFRQGSFVPHEKNTYDEQVPVSLSMDAANPPKNHDILLNLAPSIPQNPGLYQRIAEVVAADESSKANARQRFKAYRQQNIIIETHTL
ncbi:MAG: DNA polymerase III subunit chi [Gammaproteobacteria bacterium]|nr:DNA polymerase III subunit chi [Gammaproteobacteria bacterium]MDH5728998.1 DNA polymerase III subunit chi [Gammaproteobacteria bacterium]